MGIYAAVYHIVSIPNGMEFYKIGDFLSVLVNCFNSQRDGILRLEPKARPA